MIYLIINATAPLYNLFKLVQILLDYLKIESIRI